MRAGIGILSILIAVGIIFFVMFSGPHGGYVPTVVQSGQTANAQAQQIAGQDQNGVRAQDSIALEEYAPGGQLRGLVVKNLLPGGPMQTAYGLQKGDIITQVGSYDVRTLNDPEMAKDQVYQGYQENQPLVILRNGQELTINPNSPLTQYHPNMFGKPGITPTGNAVPPPPAQTQDPMSQIKQQLQTVPTH